MTAPSVTSQELSGLVSEPPRLKSSTTRAELLRALAAVVLSPPSSCCRALEALGLPKVTGAEHTAVFVLAAPPHAAIYLGKEGKLGGEGLDRVAGYWRAIGLESPTEADHLGLLLALYSELLDAQAAARSELSRDRLMRVRETLLTEHVWAWVPGYLAAVGRLGAPGLSGWAQLTLSALHREARTVSTPSLALALRSAPGPLGTEVDRDELLDALVTPVRSGLVVTNYDLREAATVSGLGYRAGERRYSLAAMLDQDPQATLCWLAGHADLWARLHSLQPAVPGEDPGPWWARRATETAGLLVALNARAAAG
jgi:hypothetical protein